MDFKSWHAQGTCKDKLGSRCCFEEHDNNNHAYYKEKEEEG
jgi:hypothetical protein